MNKLCATIFDIQRNSFVDGPGIRTTVFFKGCNLNCKWCHNPESQSFKKEILFYQNRCTGCGRCKNITIEDTDFRCFNSAKEFCGKEYTVDDIFREVQKDRAFFEASGGGVTFSGGECMLQIDFLVEILKKCKENGIHTAIDTAGHLPFEYFERVLPYTDLFLYDIKLMNEQKHKEYTGVTNQLILKNLIKLLQSDARVWVRIPLIHGVNDTEEEALNIRAFFDANGYPENTEPLPYHSMGEHKYAALGRIGEKFDAPDKSYADTLAF